MTAAARPAEREVVIKVVVSDDGNTMTANWERSDDGSTWLPWMDVKLTRAK